MKKKQIYSLFIVVMGIMLLIPCSSFAKSETMDFKVQMCRVLPPQFCGEVRCPGGTLVLDIPCDTCSEDGRWHVRGQQNAWNVSQDIEISDGDEYVIGIMTIVLNANCSGPPPLGGKDCNFWGTFELVPDHFPGSSWVGTWTNKLHDGEWKVRFNGHGTGAFEGLKIKSYDTGIAGAPQICISPPGIPRPLTGIIHSPDGYFP